MAEKELATKSQRVVGRSPGAFAKLEKKKGSRKEAGGLPRWLPLSFEGFADGVARNGLPNRVYKLIE